MVCMLDLQLSEPNYPYYMFTQKSFTLRLSQSLPRKLSAHNHRAHSSFGFTRFLRPKPLDATMLENSHRH